MTAQNADPLVARFADLVPVGCVPMGGVRVVRYLEPDGDESVRVVRHSLDGDDGARFKVADGDVLATAIGALMLSLLGCTTTGEAA